MPGVTGWALFGAAVRWWQLGLEKRPFFARDTIMGYPIFMAVSASFGYWLSGVQERRMQALLKKKEELLEKRARAAATEQKTVTGEEVLVVA